MSRTYRNPGWMWYKKPYPPEAYRDNGVHWQMPDSFHKTCNRLDRRRWNREALKPEPQLPRNHRHWGQWVYW